MKRIKTYWLLLLALVYTATAVLSVGQTQARYVNTADWDTVLGEAEAMVTSDLLQSVTDPDVTVLLGEMPQDTYRIPITLESGADVEGELTWEVQQPGYLTVEMSVDDAALAIEEPEAQSEEKENLIHLEAGKPTTIVMNLIPEENIFAAPRPAEQVLVTVRWGDVLQGNFLVEFPAVEEEPEVTEPEATEPEVTEPEVTEPEATEPEVTEPEVTEPEVTEPEVTEPEVTEPEVTEPEVTEPGVTEPEVTEPEVTEPEATEPEATESEETEPQATESESTEPQLADSGTTEPASGDYENNETEPTDPALAESAATDPTALESGDTDPVSDLSENGDDQDQASSEVSGTESSEEANEESDDSVEPTVPNDGENASAALEETTDTSGTGDEQDQESGDETEEPGTETPGTEDPGTETPPTEEPGGASGDLNEEEEPPAPADPVEIEVVADECVDADSRLTVQIVPPNDVEKLQLGLGNSISPTEGSEETTETVLGAFPRFLCYSDNGGEHYYMLYHTGLIEVAVSAEGTLPLLLDFSRTEIEGEELVIAVSGLRGESLVGSGSAVVSIKPQERAELSSCLLSEQQPLRVDIPESWNEYTSEVVIEVLSCIWNEEGTTCEMEYSPVEPEEIGLKLETETDTGALILEIGDVLPPAGTYRISIHWTSEEECVAEMQENFFINYLAYHKVVETGGAEQ